MQPTTKRELRVGDLVLCVAAYDSNELIVGCVGKIVATSSNGEVGVEYEYDVSGHDLNGLCPYGHGWWTSPKVLERYVAPEIAECPISYEEIMA